MADNDEAFVGEPWYSTDNLLDTVKEYQVPVVAPVEPEISLDMTDEPEREAERVATREATLDEVAEVTKARAEEKARRREAREREKARRLAEIEKEVDAAPQSTYKQEDSLVTPRLPAPATTKKAGLGWVLAGAGGLFAFMLLKSRRTKNK
jgi:hypothetical protein